MVTGEDEKCMLGMQVIDQIRQCTHRATAEGAGQITFDADEDFQGEMKGALSGVRGFGSAIFLTAYFRLLDAYFLRVWNVFL